jgi:taurine dioxygenase
MEQVLKFRLLEPFGVEIERDLAIPLAPPEAAHFRELFNAHGLILARGQSLTMAQQRALCAHLGPILDREGENGVMSNVAGGYAAVELSWHSDAAYTEHPFDALSLHAIDVVDGASSTCFVSAEQAYDALPPALRDRLDKADQEMISPHYSALSGRTCTRREPEAMKRGVRPAVFVNPHNGRRCVWVGELQTARLLDREWEESRDLLCEVFDRVYASEQVHEHRWRNGDLIVWDNIALQHMRGNLDQVGKRVLQRVIVGTEGVAPHVPG